MPVYFNSYNTQTQTQNELHRVDTRLGHMISGNLTRVRISEKCLRNNLHIVLNETPKIVLEKVKTHSYKGFSNYAKKYLIDKYSFQCNTDNCYVCEHEFD